MKTFDKIIMSFLILSVFGALTFTFLNERELATGFLIIFFISTAIACLTYLWGK